MQTTHVFTLLEQNNGIITSELCKEMQIPSVYLTRLVKQGILERVGRGIYVDSSGDYDTYFFFQKRFKRAIFSHSSALYLHGLIDRIPHQMEVTLYKGYNPHTIENARAHIVKQEVYELAITEEVTLFGNRVRVYDVEKTICDIVKQRKTMDIELFKKAINNYIRSDQKDLNKLIYYAQIMKIERKVRDIMEVLYE